MDQAIAQLARGPAAAGDERRFRRLEHRGLRVRLSLAQKRPGLEDVQLPLLVHGPLDVLRCAEKLFQLARRRGQAHGLVLGQGQGPGGRIVHDLGAHRAVDQHQPLLLAAGQSLVGPVSARGEQEHVRGDLAAHQRQAETRDALHQQPLARAVRGRAAGVDHARGGRVDHGQHEHGHGRLLVAQARADPVEERLRGVLGGHHLEIRPKQAAATHAEHRVVLAGKAVVAVLVQGRGTHRHPQGWACVFGTEMVEAVEDLVLDRVRDLHSPYQGHQGLRDLLQARRLLRDDARQQQVQGRPQTVVLDQQAEGGGGDGEAGRHPGRAGLLQAQQVVALVADEFGLHRLVVAHRERRDEELLGRFEQQAGVEIVLFQVVAQAGGLAGVHPLQFADHALHRRGHAQVAPPGAAEILAPAVVVEFLELGHQVVAGAVVDEQGFEGLVGPLQHPVREQEPFGPVLNECAEHRLLLRCPGNGRSPGR